MSAYAGFDVLIDDGSGVVTPVAGATVKVYDVTAAAALADLTTDGSGHVAAGTYPAVPAGRVLRFRIDNLLGRSGLAEQVTT